MTAEQGPRGPTQATLKRLFAFSGNQCSFPDCPSPIVQGETVTGEVCHIKGRKPGAPRYDATQTAKERHSYENLILLCSTHHTIVDSDAERYSADRLMRMKALHEQRATAMADADSEHAAELFMNQQVTSVDQTGGITAHTVNIINHGPIAAEGARADARPSPLDDYTFVSNGGEQIARTPSRDKDGHLSEFVYWHRSPTAWLRLIPSMPKTYGRAELLRLVENAPVPLVPFGGGHSARIFPNDKGVVTIGFDGELPDTIATRIAQVFRTGEIWAHDRVLIDPTPFESHGTCRIPWPTLNLEFERALANYLQFAKQSLQLRPPVTVVAGLALVKNAEFIRDKSKWFTNPPKSMRCLEQSVARYWPVHDLGIAPGSLLDPFYEAVFDACSLDYATEPRVHTWPR